MTTNDVSLNSELLDEFNTEEAKKLHEAIDGLSACGVGKIVNLPQIIVVGDQSCGKSSVLESLCHIRFPVDDGVCTLFATELVLSPAPTLSVNATIKFADSRPPYVFPRTDFREEDLPDIISEAKERMGISSGAQFSKDVLCLRIEGPKMHPLTLVDLPGFFSSVTETQSESGKHTVDSLVSEYMSRENSIILLVVSADLNLAKHGALNQVKAAAGSQHRTLGVITKPDLARPGSANEVQYLKLAKNQEDENKLQLGWHVLRNRTESESDLEARDDLEREFFKRGAWASVPSQNLGVSSLRAKLSRVLYEHTRANLPKVINDIESNLRDRQHELACLGESRSEPSQMRSFLINIADKFQLLARDGIYGRYEDSFFGSLEDEDHKLRAQLRNLNRAFDHTLSTKGPAQVILADRRFPHAQVERPEYLQNFMDRYPYDFPDPAVTTEAEVNSKLQLKAAANQGREFPGAANKDLAMGLFQEQVRPWEGIARFHIEQVTDVAKAFVDELFEHIVGSPSVNRTTEAILATCVDTFFEEKQSILEKKLQELLRPYTGGYPVALDSEFHAMLKNKSSMTVIDGITRYLKHLKIDEKEDVSELDTTFKAISDVLSRDKSPRAGDFETQNIIDTMQIYYEMARRAFSTNVINLAIESCLVLDIPDILTPVAVSSMTEERLAELASETADVTLRRSQLHHDIKSLRDGLQCCQRYKPRAVTGKVVPSTRRDKFNPPSKPVLETPPSSSPLPAGVLPMTPPRTPPKGNRDVSKTHDPLKPAAHYAGTGVNYLSSPALVSS